MNATNILDRGPCTLAAMALVFLLAFGFGGVAQAQDTASDRAVAEKPSGEATFAQDRAARSTRIAVVDFARRYLGTRYKYGTGAASCPTIYQKPGSVGIDCECLNRLAVYGGTKRATGRPLQLHYTLWGQIERDGKNRYFWRNPSKGDLVFFDTGGDGLYGGDYDHTGVVSGNGTFINANPVYGTINQSIRAYNNDVGHGRPLYVDVLSVNGY